MTALRIEPPTHEPQVVTVRCESCRHVYARVDVVGRRHDRCPQCGDRGSDPVEVVCDVDLESWPCAEALADVDQALRNWAVGDYSFQAAAELVIRSSLREKMVPTYVHWGSTGFVAYPAFEQLARDYSDGDAHLCSSELALLRLAANITNGPAGAGALVDLRALWNLGEENLRAVTDALIPAMRRRPAMAVAR